MNNLLATQTHTQNVMYLMIIGCAQSVRMDMKFSREAADLKDHSKPQLGSTDARHLQIINAHRLSLDSHAMQ